MAATTASGGLSGAIIAALGAAAVAGTITVALVTAGVQHELNQQACATSGDNLVSQEVPTSGGGGGTIDGIPADYMQLYSSAASEYGLDVAILAAVGHIETKHGTITEDSYAGAQGPMQFVPTTWDAVGYDANGDGTADVEDPEDAIPSAAKYLRDSGAPEDYHAALFAYNNAGWYVQDVLAQADEYRASMEGGGGQIALIGAAFPSAGDVVAPPVRALTQTVGPSLAMSAAHATEQTWHLVDPNLHHEDYSSRGAEGLMDMNPSTHPTAPTSHDEEVYYGTWGKGGGGGGGSEGVPVSYTGEQEKGEAVMPISGAGTDSLTDSWSSSEGTDLEASEGTEVRSLVGGKVVQHNGDQESVMVEADYDVGTVRKGDLVFLSGLKGQGVQVGDRVSAGQKLGFVGGGGLHLGLYDPTGARSQAASGAMDPFPVVNWLAENGGKASGTQAEAPACESPQSAGGGESGGGSGGSGDSAASGSGSEVVAEAEKYMGVPYLLGGPEACVPGETMDCTCLTTTVYAEWGYSLPDAPQSTLEYGEEVSEPAPGDLIVFPDPGDGTGGHVGIAVGNGEMIHACLPCGEVVVGPISGAETPDGYRRLVG